MNQPLDITKKVDINEIIDSAHSNLRIPERIRHLFESGENKNTKRTYRNMLKRFADAGYSIPCPPEEMSIFLGDLHYSGLKLSSIRVALAAVKFFHTAQGYSFNTEHPAIKTILRGVAQHDASAPNRAPPITPEVLKGTIDYMRNEIETSRVHVNRFAMRRDIAMMLLLFTGMFRISEVLNLKYKDLVFRDDGIKVFLRKSKTNQDGSEEWKAIAYSTNPYYCPVTELNNYIDRYFGSKFWMQQGFLFYGMGKDFRSTKDHIHYPNMKKMNESSYRDRLKNLIKRAGYGDQYSSHSFRSGGITAAARSGQPIHKIMSQSGHKNTATVDIYIRELDRFDDNVASDLL